MAKFANAQRGFTLIEMSIVLVIIGLIVGGILKGQELIESSRQKNAISQVDRVRAGVTTFTDRYRALPGDFANAAGVFVGGGTGNEDGIIGAIAANVAGLMTTNGATGENKNFFNQLAASELLGGVSIIGGAVDATAFAGGAVASPLPQAPFPATGWTIAYGVHQGGAAVTLTSAFNWLRMSKFNAGALTGGAAGQAAMSPQRAFQLDQKYDDGLPMTGSIRSGAVGTGCGTAGADTGYTVATTNIECVMLFQIN